MEKDVKSFVKVLKLHNKVIEQNDDHLIRCSLFFPFPFGFEIVKKHMQMV
jgi:hypothetical protein